MPSPYDTLDLRQLKCFWAVARSGSLTRAGVELGVTESAIAQRVRALEQQLGVKLYETPGGRVRLTQAGERVFEMATGLFDEIEAFRSGLIDGSAGGRLRVAAEESVLLYLLPEPVRHFLAAFPEAELEVLSRAGSDSLDLVQTGAVDLAITAYQPMPRSVVFRPWQEIPGFVVASAGHPLEGRDPLLLEDFLEYPMILPERGTGAYQRVREVLDLAGREARVAMEVGSWEAVKRYVALGLGVSVVPGMCLTEADRANLFTRRVGDQYSAATTYGVLLRRRKEPTRVLDAFLQFLSPSLAMPGR